MLPFSPPADWYAPARCTCSVWAIVQRHRLGGRISFQRHQKIPYLFRGFWQPAAPIEQPGQWYAYLPDHPKDHKTEHWWTVLRHSLWFEGHPQRATRR